MTISTDIVIIGFLTGLVYAILAAGLVLIYRSTRVINFAHGEIGAFGAAILAILVLDHGWNWFAAFALVLVIGAAVGGVWERLVVRRLFAAPRLVLLVATIGIAQVMFFAQAQLPGIKEAARYPTGIDAHAKVAGAFLGGEHFIILVFVPLVIGALAWFLGRTHAGRVIHATADNADAARLAGVDVKRVSTLVWVIAGALSTATFVLISPVRGVIVGQASVALGPGLLMRGLAAALVGGLVSLPLALAGGIGLGIGEALLFANVRDPGVVDFWVFMAVLAVVLWKGRAVVADESTEFSLTAKEPESEHRVGAVDWRSRFSRAGMAGVLVVALILPFVFRTSANQFLFSRVVLYALIGLSVVVLTGWAGQLSLGQFAFVGVGAMVVAGLHSRAVPFGVAVVWATVAGVLVALLIGGPALRFRGLSLAVTTLAFAIAARGYLFTHRLFTGDASVVFVPRGRLGPFNLADQRTYYYLCLAILVAAVLIVSQLRRSGVGRTIIAVRDNDRAAASFSVSPARAKLMAFAMSGGLAALGGALLGGLQVQYSASAFPVEESLRVVAMVIIGGLSSVSGAVLGAVYVLGVPALIQDSAAVRLLTSGIGLLLLLLFQPAGLIRLVHRARDWIVERFEERRGAPAVPEPVESQAVEPDDVVSVPVDALPAAPERDPVGAEDGAAEVALALRGVTVRFGGLAALSDVTVTANRHETVGIIGSNGAGKSTLMDVASGFLLPDEGTVELFGTDVSRRPAHERAELGVGRLFQDAKLFPNLTVRESVAVALEARERTELVPAMLHLPPSVEAERAKGAQAAELLDLLGLTRYAASFASDLSTGTRRIAELACLLALEPRVVLLDEPTAGLAQRETEAFGPLLGRVRAQLGVTAILIEHDMPLVMSLADRIYCLSAGQVIAEGPPDSVRNDPKVIAAYLGTDERTINRSDAGRDAVLSHPSPGSAQ